MIAGTDLPLWGLEIDSDEAAQRFRASSAADSGKARSSGVELRKSASV